MADDVVLLEKCASCGADVREGTAFCYNCGKSVVAERPEMIEEAAPEVAAVNTSETEEDEKLAAADRSARRASAAIERKRSRVGTKRQTKVVWEAPGATADRIYLLLCILLFVIAVAVVTLTTFVK